jgi:type IV fimbrial biogenesis protein FimT
MASRGFTLIEIAITLAVLAILGALALPGLGAGLERTRLHAAAQSLAADLAEARFEAARRGTPLHLVVNAGERDACWAVATQADCTCGAPQPCQLRRVTQADLAGVRLLEARAVQLDPQGQVQQPVQAATLASRSGDERLRVDVSALGRARVCAVSGHRAHKVPAC